METVIRYAISLILVLLLTRWLTRKYDPSSEWKDFFFPLLVRILLGSAYGYIFLRQYGGDDTWMIHWESRAASAQLVHHPWQFFEDINLARLLREEGWRMGFQRFREQLEFALLIKPLALANFITKGNYYSNIIFFNAVCFWGSYWLYLLFKQQFPRFKKELWLVLFFYLPTVFWLSGIRSDGLLFLFFSGSLWNFHQWLQKGKSPNLFYLVVHLAGMVVTRAAYVVILVPGLIAWRLSATGKWPSWKYFGLSYGIAIVLFFTSSLFPEPFNGPEMVVKKQAAFQILDGKTRVPLANLEANPLSFIRVLPQAINHSFVRPYPHEARSLLHWMMIIQNFFLICVGAMAILLLKPKQFAESPPLVKLLLVFALLVYLSIGYTVPFPGAIVRYRAIPETCLLLLSIVVLLKKGPNKLNFI